MAFAGLAFAALVVLWQAALWVSGPPRSPRDIPLPALSEHGAIQGDSPLRLTILGTSLTALYDWPVLVQDQLARCPTPVLITTVARPGATSPWGLEQIAAVLATDPDIVLIEFAANDADIRDGLWPGQSREVLEKIITDLRATDPAPALALMTMNPAQGPRGWMRPTQGAQARMYHDLAQAQSVGLVDFYPRWQALPRSERGLRADGLHPDAQVAQRLIVPVLSMYLAEGHPLGCTL